MSTTKENKINQKNVEYNRFIWLILMCFYLKSVEHLNLVVAMLHQKMLEVTTRAWHTNWSYSSRFNVAGVDFDTENPI